MTFTSQLGSQYSMLGRVMYGSNHASPVIPDTESAEIPFFMFGQIPSGTLPFYMSGYETTNASGINFYIQGVETLNEDIPLYIGGITTDSDPINMMLRGPRRVGNAEAIPLFLNGSNGSGQFSTLPFHLQAPTDPIGSGGINFTILGDGGIPSSGHINFSIKTDTEISTTLNFYVENYGATEFLPFHTIAGGFINSPTDPVYGIPTEVSGGINFFIQRPNYVEVIPFFIQGPAVPTSGGINFVMTGSYDVGSGVNFVMPNIKDSSVASLSFYNRGW